MKRIVAMILCVAAILALVTGCNTTEKLNELVTKYNSNMEDVVDENTQIFNYMDADTVVLTVDDEDITWSEFACWFILQKNELKETLKANNIVMESWMDEISGYGMTYAEYVMNQTLVLIQSYRSVRNNAEALGVTLTESDKLTIQNNWDAAVAEYDGTETEYTQYIQEFYGSLDLYTYIQETDALYYGCYNKQYGVSGNKLTDDQVFDYIEDDGYMMAKHILISPESATGISDVDVELEEDGTDPRLAEAEELANQIWNMLNEYTGADIEEYFDELMMEYNADTSENEYFPGGYLFTEGQMVSEFEETVKSIEEGEISEPVKTDYGYHIIMKLPIDLDATPISYSDSVANGQSNSLRYIVSMSMFVAATDGWRENTSITVASELENLNVEDMLSRK